MKPSTEYPRVSPRRRVMELVIFVAASVLGVYGLGRGLDTLFEGGRAVDLAWLAISAIGVLVLFAQMGRVHDSWPRRTVARRPAGREREIDATGDPPRGRDAAQEAWTK